MKLAGGWRIELVDPGAKRQRTLAQLADDFTPLEAKRFAAMLAWTYGKPIELVAARGNNWRVAGGGRRESRVELRVERWADFLAIMNAPGGLPPRGA